MSIWERIFKTLKDNGIEVYPPATHKGECRKPYVVVKQDGSTQVGDFSSERVYYQFLLYVPQNKYQELDNFENEVKGVLATELYPLLMPTGSNMPDYFEEEKKAHMRSFMYTNNRRNKHL